jgi:hypothetical protein
VENLADACLAALDWPAGAYNIADQRPYPRDATIRAVLAAAGVWARVAHVPVRLARTVAAVAEPLGRLTGARPALTRYAVDQLAEGVVLDIAKATARGWLPARSLADFLAAATPRTGPPARGRS